MAYFGAGSYPPNNGNQQNPASAGFFSPQQYAANPYGGQPQQTNQYKPQLDNLLTNPGSFSGTPGFQFALDQGMEGVQRSNSAGRNSGNALAALAKYGTGLAQQDYGNQVDRLGRLSNQQDQFNVNTEQNRLTGENNANQFQLGIGRNANDAQSNVNTAHNNANQFQLGLGQNANQFELGMGQNANTAQNNWWNNENNVTQNSNQAALNQNNFNTNQGRNQIDWFNAGTNRGNSMADQYYAGQRNARDWAQFNNGRR